jgi:hypothetical protein
MTVTPVFSVQPPPASVAAVTAISSCGCDGSPYAGRLVQRSVFFLAVKSLEKITPRQDHLSRLREVANG